MQKANELEKYRKELVKDIERWQYINENGCNDPFWTDGSNMNLVRNHVIYHKRIIFDICQETGTPLPDEYYLVTPPEVSNYYMNNLKQLYIPLCFLLIKHEVSDTIGTVKLYIPLCFLLIEEDFYAYRRKTPLHSTMFSINPTCAIG